MDPVSSVPDAGALAPATRVAETLRAAGIALQLHAGGGSMKSQFRRADASGARWALIFGADELARGEVAVKPLRDATAAQTTRALADAAAWALTLRDA